MTIIIIIISPPGEVFLLVLTCDPSTESESLQIPGTLFSIPADLNSAVVWIESILPLISSSLQSIFKAQGSSKCTNYNWYHCHPDVP